MASHVCTGCSRTVSGVAKDKEPLKKAKTPQGRFDSTEEKQQEVLKSEDTQAADLSISSDQCLP